MRKIIFSSLLCVLAGNAYANVIINGTRVIYPQENKDVIVQLFNNSETPSLIQSWIDDGDIKSTPETSKAPFLVSPPVVKVNGDSGQQIRIQLLSNSLPKDRESIYYLNVLDIPPTKDGVTGMNVVQMAIRTRIKLFVRPKSIVNENKDPSRYLSYSVAQNKLTNKGPFFITIYKISCNKKVINKDPVMIAPFSDQNMMASGSMKAGEVCQFTYVNDLGGYNNNTIKLN